ncbi:MAG: hypothetical protein IJT58_08060 [Synergistaceae bacterium]|nr:hypothetical protein [Synergistaceae bacterium]
MVVGETLRGKICNNHRLVSRKLKTGRASLFFVPDLLRLTCPFSGVIDDYRAKVLDSIQLRRNLHELINHTRS